jgi:hypothetical protein
MPYDKAISYSGMSLYKQCPKLWHDSYILGNKSPSGPAAERGTRLHDALEKFFKGEFIFPVADKTLAPWERYMKTLMRFEPSAEAEVAVDQFWRPVAFDDPGAWFRGKKDLDVRTSIRKHIFDWKSGKIYPDHVQQGKAYVALDPEDWDEYVVKFAYLDIPLHVQKWRYTAPQKLEIRGEIDQVIEVIRMDEEHRATPGDKCQWCHKSWRRGGDCTAAY